MLIIISIAWTPADFKKNYTLPFSEKNVLINVLYPSPLLIYDEKLLVIILDFLRNH